jgi:hypothetical protein
MKTIGIILIILQIVGLFGSVVNGSISTLFLRGIPYLLGYFLPAIIGIILLTKASKKNKE